MISFRGPWRARRNLSGILHVLKRFSGRCLLFLSLACVWSAMAQSPFQFPTANQYLYTPGAELKFFAPTEPDKPWTSGSFGCVRDYGHRNSRQVALPPVSARVPVRLLN